jgi:hypothetical protein
MNAYRAMTTNQSNRRLLATVDTRELETLRWGPMRAMFPSFVEEIELGRYLKRLLRSVQCSAVEIAPHGGSTHVFDVFVVEDRGAPGPRT